MNQKNKDLDSIVRIYQALLWYTSMTIDKYGEQQARDEAVELLRFMRFAYFMFALDMMPEGEMDDAEKQAVLDSLGPVPTAEQLGSMIKTGGGSVGSSN